MTTSKMCAVQNHKTKHTDTVHRVFSIQYSCNFAYLEDSDSTQIHYTHTHTHAQLQTNRNIQIWPMQSCTHTDTLAAATVGETVTGTGRSVIYFDSLNFFHFCLRVYSKSVACSSRTRIISCVNLFVSKESHYCLFLSWELKMFWINRKYFSLATVFLHAESCEKK